MYPSVSDNNNNNNKQNNKKQSNIFKSTSQYIFNDYLKTGNKPTTKKEFYGTSANISKNNLLYINLFIRYLKYFLPLESNSKVRLMAKPTKQETGRSLYNDTYRLRSLKKIPIQLTSVGTNNNSTKSNNNNDKFLPRERIMKGSNINTYKLNNNKVINIFLKIN